MYEKLTPTRQERNRAKCRFTNWEFENFLKSGEDDKLRFLLRTYITQAQNQKWDAVSSIGKSTRQNRIADLEAIIDRRKANGGGDHEVL